MLYDRLRDQNETGLDLIELLNMRKEITRDSSS